MTQPVPGDATKQAKHASRRQGRELALQWLFSFESNRYTDDGRLLPSDAEAEPSDEVKAFALRITDGFKANRTPIDAAIDKRLTNWTIHRLAATDRNILRIGAFELLYCSDTPVKVAISEAVELSKRYGTEDKTAKLVNGVLDTMAREHRPEEMSNKRPGKPVPATAPAPAPA